MRPNLIEARKSNNLTQQEVAEMVGLKSKASISMLERGISRGHPEIWQALSEIFNTKPEVLWRQQQ